MAIFFFSISFYMMVTTKYMHALGDYVIEFVGLKAWTGEYSGTHLTIFYFGILTIIGLFQIHKYAIDELGIRKRYVLILCIAFITILNSATSISVRSVKKHSDHLLSIGCNYKNSKMSFASKDTEFTQFKADIEMMNYSDRSKEFNLTIVSPFHREGTAYFDIFTKGGNKAIFNLSGNETKILNINLDEYKIVSRGFPSNISGNGDIQEVILTDKQGNSIRLDVNNFLGIELNR